MDSSWCSCNSTYLLRAVWPAASSSCSCSGGFRVVEFEVADCSATVEYSPVSREFGQMVVRLQVMSEPLHKRNDDVLYCPPYHKYSHIALAVGVFRFERTRLKTELAARGAASARVPASPDRTCRENDGRNAALRAGVLRGRGGRRAFARFETVQYATMLNRPAGRPDLFRQPCKTVS
jgi:hypothetical protein